MSENTLYVVCVQRKLDTFPLRLRKEAFNEDFLRAYVCVVGWLRGEFSVYVVVNFLSQVIFIFLLFQLH